MLRKASEKDVSCRIELVQRRDFKEFFDILENAINENGKTFSTENHLYGREYAV